MIVWPFPVRDDGPHPGRDGSGQWRRIDKGQDLQAAVGTPLLAVAAGRMTYASDPAHDGGFGIRYPVLVLDTPTADGPAVYYGHNDSTLPPGTHVTQGQIIGATRQVPGGNAHNLPGWLELGWWRNGPTGDGRAMHAALLAAPVYPGDDDVTEADKVDLVNRVVAALGPVIDAKVNAAADNVNRHFQWVGPNGVQPLPGYHHGLVP